MEKASTWLSFLFLTYCISCKVLSNEQRNRMSASLIQERINPICAQSADSVLIRVHPILKHRDDIFSKKGEFLNEQDLYGDLFKQKDKNHTVDLSAYSAYFKACQLPPKAKNSNDIDTFLFFASPLLKGKEKGIYIMQYFVVDSHYFQELGYRIIFAERYYLRYRWQKGRLEFIEKLRSDHDFFNPLEGLPKF